MLGLFLTAVVSVYYFRAVCPCHGPCLLVAFVAESLCVCLSVFLAYFRCQYYDIACLFCLCYLCSRLAGLFGSLFCCFGFLDDLAHINVLDYIRTGGNILWHNPVKHASVNGGASRLSRIVVKWLGQQQESDDGDAGSSKVAEKAQPDAYGLVLRVVCHAGGRILCCLLLFRSGRYGLEDKAAETVQPGCEYSCLARLKLVVPVIVDGDDTYVVELVRAIMAYSFPYLPYLVADALHGLRIADVVCLDIRLCQQGVVHCKLWIKPKRTQWRDERIVPLVKARVNMMCHKAAKIRDYDAIIVKEQYFYVSLELNHVAKIGFFCKINKLFAKYIFMSLCHICPLVRAQTYIYNTIKIEDLFVGQRRRFHKALNVSFLKNVIV